MSGRYERLQQEASTAVVTLKVKCVHGGCRETTFISMLDGKVMGGVPPGWLVDRTKNAGEVQFCSYQHYYAHRNLCEEPQDDE